MSPDYPDYLAARNNLALAYYYMGLFSKAKETIGEVLEQEPGNLHALCNLAIFYQNENRTDQVLLLIKTACARAVPARAGVQAGYDDGDSGPA